MLFGKNIYLRPFEITDAKNLLDYQIKNRSFFQSYEPIHSEEEFTLDYQIQYIITSKLKSQTDMFYSFGIFQKETDKLVGLIALSGITRGPFQSCFVGYSLDEEYNGRGYMRESVQLICEFVFNKLNLHRIEAFTLPTNKRSIRVLKKTGFVKEGCAKNYLEINGKWEDHYIFALVLEDYKLKRK